MDSSYQVSRNVKVAATVAASAVLAFGLGYYALRSSSERAARVASRVQLYVRVLFGSVTGTSERWARRVAADIRAEALGKGLQVEVVLEDLATFAFDQLLEKKASAEHEAVLVLLSTQVGGEAPDRCRHFVQLLEDHLFDFRVGKTALLHLAFAVVGFGSSEYSTLGHFCTAAERVDKALHGLGARRLTPLLRVDDTEEATVQFRPWTPQTLHALWREAVGEGQQAVSEHMDGDDEEEWSDDASSAGLEADTGATGKVADLEELDESCAGTTGSGTKEMLTSKMRQQLTKEGYKILGTHSAVKLCRWTKHQLRGRGGCYKHSFYGISSYQCMEATPSLACANKCTFCWRHHKNPVGTEWKWKMDPPEMIVSEGIEAHRQMIREAKGIPGVKPERHAEAMTVKHCALSLVGEPIMYPKINEFVDSLHSRNISTFLVTNAQFPEAIQKLNPVTQLYVSCDAATPDALKAIDRPLFSNFWERYLESLRSLRDKGQRTVYRLTLVKDQNMSEPAAYAKLVALGEPDFIEIKSVTFCGESKASALTIGNVPWHEEVRQFSESMLAAEGLADEYELACEHQHSNIVLIAHKRFKLEGKWNTWIDYTRFHQLVSSGKPFGSMDYLAETPAWAVYGAAEAGFDPKEKREYHNRTKRRPKEGLLSEAQLAHYPENPADAT